MSHQELNGTDFSVAECGAEPGEVDAGAQACRERKGANDGDVRLVDHYLTHIHPAGRPVCDSRIESSTELMLGWRSVRCAPYPSSRVLLSDEARVQPDCQRLGASKRRIGEIDRGKSTVKSKEFSVEARGEKLRERKIDG